MVAAMVPERDVRGPGCDERCEVVGAVLVGRTRRPWVLLHHPSPHEEFGRWLSQAPGEGSHVVRTGPLKVDMLAGTVEIEGHPIHLTPNELRLMLALARQAGALISVSALVASVWGASVLETPQASWLHLVRVNLCRLRARLGTAGPLVATVLGMGVRLDLREPCDVTPVEGYGGVSLSGRWSLRWESCRECRTTRYPHNGRGLCTSCQGRLRHFATKKDGWSRDWVACRDCERDDVPYYGHGYCDTCARRRKRRGEGW